MLTSLQQHVLNEIECYQKTGDFWCVNDETGAFLHDLVLKHRCQYAVECGSGIGCSTLWIASAVKKNGGNMFGYEFFQPKCEQANSYMRQARLGSTVEIICASAAKGIPHLERGMDFVFLDARKCDYLRHFELLKPKLKKGALVVADNVTSHAAELDEYLKYVRKHYPSEFFDIGTGVEVTRLLSSRL